MLTRSTTRPRVANLNRIVHPLAAVARVASLQIARAAAASTNVNTTTIALLLLPIIITIIIIVVVVVIVVFTHAIVVVVVVALVTARWWEAGEHAVVRVAVRGVCGVQHVRRDSQL